MSLDVNIKKLGELVAAAQTILVLQPEKPDGDSLSISLALEQILGDLGKEVAMYSKDDIPEYIRTLDGWDRVTDKFPSQFDLTILVDTGGPQMIARTLEKHQKALVDKPFVIIDHHGSREPMPFEVLEIVDPECASATELLVNISRQLDWNINLDAGFAIVNGILSDTGGFRHTNTDAEVLQVAADMAKLGVSLPELNERHRALDALTPDLLHYKGQLLQRIEYFADKKLALVAISPSELAVYADLHDPADLAINDMRATKGVLIAIVIRDYGTKIKVSTRANIDIADKVCSHFGGGGHPRASGFRVDDKPLEELKKEIVEVTTKLIKEHEAL